MSVSRNDRCTTVRPRCRSTRAAQNEMRRVSGWSLEYTLVSQNVEELPSVPGTCSRKLTPSQIQLALITERSMSKACKSERECKSIANSGVTVPVSRLCT